MKINIASPGRFHVLDLARELNKLGHDVRFYSFVPDKRAQKFGLPKKCNRSLFLPLLPFLAITRFTGKFKMLYILVQDFLTGLFMRKCDVFIAMSGNYVYSLKKAKKHGAKIVLERGSKHILEQKRILESIPGNVGKKPVPDINVKRELEGYELADYISIAATHVKNSFIERGFPADKLFVNPYGVELKDFYKSDADKVYDVIMVGGWSYRKGVDLLSETIRRLNLSFIHVGGIVDVEFPNDPNFHHVNPVDQKELVKYYNKAKVFAIASREEGMALVQMQAFACGLPVVCSMHTGGIEIANVTGCYDNIFEMEEYTVEDLMEKIQQALSFYERNTDLKPALENLSWEAYGKRYENFLRKI